MQISKYLLASEHDRKWGLTVSTVGYEEIATPPAAMLTATISIVKKDAN